MTQYIIRRLLVMPLLLWGLVTITFAISRAAPADPIATVVDPRSLQNEEIVAAARRRWGLDQSLPEQYVRYLGNLVFHGDMGISFRTHRHVRDDLADRLPATAELAIAALILAAIAGISLGIVAAVKQNSWVDHLTRLFAVTGSSMPVFWLGLVFLFTFWTQLGWLPGPGRLDSRTDTPPDITGFYTIDALIRGDPDAFVEAGAHLLMPAFVLGWAVMGLISRLVRASMLDVLNQDYVRTARSKGLRERTVLLRHALKNALIPTLTVLGLSFALLITGAVLVEQIFSWPGIGRYTVLAAQSLDFPAIQGVAIFAGGVIVVLSLITDVTYAIVDPRIRLS